MRSEGQMVIGAIFEMWVGARGSKHRYKDPRTHPCEMEEQLCRPPNAFKPSQLVPESH